MVCDYYIQSDLVVVFYDNQGALSTTKTNRILEKGYLIQISDKEPDDDENIYYKKYKEELKSCIERNTYKKILYENNKWIKKSYEKKYLKEINRICPRMIKLVRIYKDYYAWESI